MVDTITMSPDAVDTALRHAELKWLPLDQLRVDERYQRPLSYTKIKRFTDNFDFNALGALWVSKRGEQEYAIIDGQHRAEAVKLVFDGNADVPCLVFEHLTEEQEAALFVKAQNRIHMNAVDVFKADLFAGNPDALEIERIVQGRGFTFGSGDVTVAKPYEVKAIGTVRAIYEQGGEWALDTILKIIDACWDADARAMHQDFFRGLFSFIMRYHGFYDEKRLISRLAEYSPLQIARRVDVMKIEDSVKDSKVAFARAITVIYNHGLREEARLPSWSDPALRKRKVPTLRRIKQEGDGYVPVGT